MIAVRLAWMFTMPYAVRLIDRRESQRGGTRRAPSALVVGWAGMRGSVSLAAALAIPLQTDAGAPFPERDLIIFLAFAVILVTLVGQGLTLGPLIERLGLRDDGEEEPRGARWRGGASPRRRSGGSRSSASPTGSAPRASAGPASLLDYRARRFGALADGDGDSFEDRADAWRRLMYDLYDAQREALLELRNRGEISDEVRRRIERDLDLEESRLEN